MPRYILTTPLDLTPHQVERIIHHARAIDPKKEAPTLARVLPRLEVHGRRWFQKTHGNTYHSVRVLLDGVRIGYRAYEYGYGDCYSQTAVEMLKELGIIPADRHAVVARDLSDLFDVVETVENVQRKKDL